ncbi:MAG: GNAT family N-acetyltransferase [Fluviicoccus sp.]|uniref:GNAT family N-acetyltransferase n=1 Tax=Fluviicoccus sp. TaxID=2003552 RepID=UPI00271AF43A|nr:GNAT family N-acetyltransferase [Fluviicoccus sp.]MDO8330562.1 GNAT family N-acetyltransferase [Fluviicoccus sp.]
MNISIRITPATLADIPALSDLLTTLFTQEAEFTPDPAAQVRGLDHIIRQPETGLILVARNEDAILGMVNLLYTVSTALGERVALLEDMVIADNARGQGIGGQLLEQAIAASRRNGCRRITLLTDRDNIVAQRFYQKHGFTASPMRPYRLNL